MAFTNLAKSIPYYIGDDFEQLASYLIREYDYIFYISPEGVELEDNGVRTINEQYRINIDTEIKKIINSYKPRIKTYTELSGTTKERIQKIKQVMSL
jgi:hypothetical protein